MPKCIYCTEEKPRGRFAKREHVLPESFGTFEHNLTLLETVCDDCNQYFGDELEIAFARDSPDGLERFITGGKNPHEYKSLGRRSSIDLLAEFRTARNVRRCLSGSPGEMDAQEPIH